jgi:hypothetical protein
LNAEPDSKFRVNALKDRKAKSLAPIAGSTNQVESMLIVEIPESDGEKTGGPVDVV